MEGDPDRPRRAPRHLGDLGVAEPGVPGEEEDLALTWRELGEGLLEAAERLSALEAPERPRVRIGDRLQRPRRRLGLAKAVTAEPVEGEVPGDGVEPGPEGPPRTVASPLKVDPEEGLLEELLGLATVAEEAGEEGEEPSGVAVVEALEGAGASAAERLHEGVISLFA